MSEERCPRCGAARRAGDQWCGLCYADFRPPPRDVVGDGQPPAAPEGVAAAPQATAAGDLPLIRPPDQPGVPAAPVAPANPAPAQPAAAGAPFVPSANPLAPAATLPTQLPEGVAPTAPATPIDLTQVTGAAPADGAPADPAADLKWPCSGCGALVPMSEDNCPACGTGFLADAGLGTSGTVKVPLIGDVGKMNSGQKLVFGAAIAFGIILGIVVLLTIGGKLF